MKTAVSWIAILALSASGATAGSVVLAAASPAGADPITECSPSAGEIVAVDFSAWGGAIERGCDATLTTGYAALHRAGFTTAGDAQDGPGFICRIDDDPPPKQESCATTPPADAYWSYWHADVGQDTWTYSQLGAIDYRPPPGSVDAWTFGSTDIDGSSGQPTFSPDSVRATDTSGSGTTTTPTSVPENTPSPSTTAVDSPGPSTTPTVAPSPVVRGSSSTRPGTGTGGDEQHASTTEPEPTSTPSSSSTTVPPRAGGRSTKIVVAAPAANERPSAGSAAPALVGTGIVLVLAALAAVVAWRRRRIS